MRNPIGAWDYVIVGAGSAGCVLANRLSANPATRVLLARGRRTGRLVLDRHPGRLSLHDRQSTHRLVLQDAARRAPGGPINPLRARPGARRMLHDQRDDLHARPERGLRLLGLTRQRGMVVERRAAAVQEGRGLSARRRRDARCRRRAARGGLRVFAGRSSRPGAMPPRNAAFRKSGSSIAATISAARSSR